MTISWRDEKFARDNFGVHKSEFESKPEKPIILADGNPLFDMPQPLPSGPIDFANEVEETATIPDEVPENHKLIEEIQGHDYSQRITQDGREYHGTITFKDPKKKHVKLISDSLAHLRLSLRNFSTQ